MISLQYLFAVQFTREWFSRVSAINGIFRYFVDRSLTG